MLAPRAELPWVSNFNGLRCQTVLKGDTDAKSLFGAVSNLPRRLTTDRREKAPTPFRAVVGFELLPDKPIALDPSVDPAHLQVQLRPLNGAAPTTRQWP
jgi:hypothetical protein